MANNEQNIRPDLARLPEPGVSTYLHSACLHTDCGQIIINSSSYTVGEGGVATFLSCPTQIPRVYVVMYLLW